MPTCPTSKKVGNLESAGEIARGLAQLGGLDVLARRVVVQHDGDFILVEHAGEAGFVKHADGDGGRYVVAEHEVELCLNQVARFDFGQPAWAARIFCVMVIPMDLHLSLCAPRSIGTELVHGADVGAHGCFDDVGVQPAPGERAVVTAELDRHVAHGVLAGEIELMR